MEGITGRLESNRSISMRLSRALRVQRGKEERLGKESVEKHCGEKYEFVFISVCILHCLLFLLELFKFRSYGLSVYD